MKLYDLFMLVSTFLFLTALFMTFLMILNSCSITFQNVDDGDGKNKTEQTPTTSVTATVPVEI